MTPHRYTFPPLVQGPGLVDITVIDKTTNQTVASIRGAEINTHDAFRTLHIAVRYPNWVRDGEGSACRQASWDFHSAGFEGVDVLSRGLLLTGFLTEANHYSAEAHQAIAAIPLSEDGDIAAVLAAAPEAQEHLSDIPEVRYTGQRIHPLAPQHFKLAIAHRPHPDEE